MHRRIPNKQTLCGNDDRSPNHRMHLGSAVRPSVMVHSVSPIHVWHSPSRGTTIFLNEGSLALGDYVTCYLR
ncbi:hypothetical protein SCLCIDRAFT_1212040 [Scleroderma citrinum Foug A]|uniref:Uncharacterized protein n=1 Tax=Scleroderma citrinum Foug A TaxID=1036808 RepID=A0A0C3AL24_9AGAM|nr:hypothetical protein SCLCIDRAFT_1212040 [Scleroderma citrinum Foug A]